MSDVGCDDVSFTEECHSYTKINFGIADFEILRLIDSRFELKHIRHQKIRHPQ
jgi:hypothetical protein